jgi:hypothetical protein
MAIPINSDCLLVEKQRPYLFWMQTRTSRMVPSLANLGLLARLFLIQAEREGYGEVGPLIADMRVLEGDQRSLSLFTLDDLPVASQDVARSGVQMMADAYDHLKAEGFDPRAERRSRQPKHGDDHGQSALI